ncbi:MAG TPA: DUF465 domain-containing protein [Magnetospirillaceae bacterium]
MSSDDHVDALKAKHAALDAALGEENRRPNPDTIAIHDIKRQKLRIKDELERIVHT